MTYETYVCPDDTVALKAHGILSRNFLNKFELYFRGQNDQIESDGQLHKLFTYKEINEIINQQQANKAKEANNNKDSAESTSKPAETIASTDITVTRRIILQPESGTCFTARTSKKKSGQYIYVPNKNNIKTKGISLQPSIHKMKNEKSVVIFVINGTDRPITLHKNTKIGKLMKLQEDNFEEIMQCDHFHCEEEAKQEYINSCDMKNGIMSEDEAELDEFEKKAAKVKDIAELIETSHMTSEQRKQLLSLVREFRDIFWLPGDKLTTTPVIQAEIDTKDHEPISVKPYRTPQKMLQPLKEEIKDLLEQDIIEPADSSPWNSPAILLSKEVNGKIKRRLVIDFRRINILTVPMTCSFPELFQTIHRAGGSTIFSTLDCLRAFQQVPLREEDRPKTAFTTEAGRFQFKTMPFGLRNAAIIFQKLVNSLFLTRADGFCQAYLDDLLAYSKGDTKDHIDKLRQIFNILREANLKLRPDKCKFFQEKVKYLGFQLSKDGIVPDDEKLDLVRNYPTPETSKHVKQFLGLTTFFSRHCPKYAEIAVPLTELTKPSTPFIWDEKCEAAFQLLKQQLCRKLMLAFPIPDQPFSIYTDASDYSLGIVCTQLQDGELKPISLASRKLSPTERKYPTWRKEILAVKFALAQFKHFVVGQPFRLYTDHLPIIYLFKSKKLSPVMERYASLFSDVNMEIVHIPGKDNTAADSCSRILLNKGNIEYLPDEPREKVESYEEFLERWENKHPKIKVKQTPTKSEQRKISRKEKTQQKKKSPLEKIIPSSEPKQDINQLTENLDQSSEYSKLTAVLKAFKIINREIEATDFTSSSREKKYREYKEKLFQIMLQADEIQSLGNEELRTIRKKVVKQIQRAIYCLKLLYHENLRVEQSVIEPEEYGIIPTDEEDEPMSSDESGPTSSDGYGFPTTSEDESSDNESIMSTCSTDDSSDNAHSCHAIDSTIWQAQQIISRNEVLQAQLHDEFYKTATNMLTMAQNDQFKTKKERTKAQRYINQYILDSDNLLYKVKKDNSRVAYIPPALQHKVLMDYHNSAFVAHPGSRRMLTMLRRKIWFPKMAAMVIKVINDCEICSKTKPNNRPFKPPMKLYRVPEKPFQDVHMDFFGPIYSLNDPEDWKYGIICYDRFSHWPEIYALPNMEASTLITALISKYTPYHGLPRRFIHDNQSTFISTEFETFCTQMNVDPVPVASK